MAPAAFTAKADQSVTAEALRTGNDVRAPRRIRLLKVYAPASERLFHAWRP